MTGLILRRFTAAGLGITPQSSFQSNCLIAPELISSVANGGFSGGGGSVKKGAEGQNAFCITRVLISVEVVRACSGGLLRLLSFGRAALGPIHTGRVRANSNANPSVLLARSVNTPIDHNRSHLLALRCASCMNGAL